MLAPARRRRGYGRSRTRIPARAGSDVRPRTSDRSVSRTRRSRTTGTERRRRARRLPGRRARSGRGSRRGRSPTAARTGTRTVVAAEHGLRFDHRAPTGGELVVDGRGRRHQRCVGEPEQPGVEFGIEPAAGRVDGLRLLDDVLIGRLQVDDPDPLERLCALVDDRMVGVRLDAGDGGVVAMSDERAPSTVVDRRRARRRSWGGGCRRWPVRCCAPARHRRRAGPRGRPDTRCPGHGGRSRPSRRSGPTPG